MPYLKELPYNCGRFIHSGYAFGYAVVVILGMIYMRYKGILAYIQLESH
jgi:hypothetical protein